MTDHERDSADSGRGVYHNVITGDWVEVEGSSEASRRSEAATRLGCDSSDIRRGYDHSDREAEDTVLAEGVLQDALGGEDGGE